MKNKKQISEKLERRAMTNRRLLDAAKSDVEELLRSCHSSKSGLTPETVEEMQKEFGSNRLTPMKRISLFRRLFSAFVNPFTLILFLLVMVTVVTDIIIVAPTERKFTTIIIILIMVVISGLVKFIQETKSDKAAEELLAMVETTTCVERDGIRSEIPLDEIVVGDLIHLRAGDIIPADLRIIRAKDLFVSQSSLTGESDAVEKTAAPIIRDYGTITEIPDLAFMGSTVISGSATAVVIVTGDDTFFGQVAKSVTEKQEPTSFDKGINAVSMVLIRFMVIMVPIVFIVNGITKNNWLNAFLFAISIAVGLTPEMLPMIVTTCLTKGAVSMSKKKTIIRNLNSIQNFGSMDILCTDKTGTLTQDRVILESHLDVHGKEDPRVLRHAFLNSYYQTGLKNLIDLSIIDRTQELNEKYAVLKDLTTIYEKVDEVPFDFSRRRMSVVVADKNGKTQMITKGAVDEILSICTHVEYEGKVEPLTEVLKKEVFKTVDNLNDQGMRVIAVAQKTNPSPVGAFSVADESGMVLMGYLSFFDPPKDTTAEAIQSLHNYGVNIKVLTGDNDRVTNTICKKVGIPVNRTLLGHDIENMTDEQLGVEVEHVNIFAKLSPDQKARVVRALRKNGHVVGYMGDGINDVPALKASDVGISVDTAVDIAKESAHVILLEKDLNVLKDGIIEGRKTYANMIKYIKMTASSNFGNMFSVLIASVFLPFLPMMPVHLLLLNLIYDISCTAIPWDNVDPEFLIKPRKWDAKSVGSFMLWIGPTSSIFDITTYLLMYFVICSHFTSNSTDFMKMFQTGWFVESMWSQTLIIHTLRTPKIPFIQSHASMAVTFITLMGIMTLTIIPFTPVGTALELLPLPPVYFAWLALTIILYMIVASLLKWNYIKKFGNLL